MRVQEIFPDAGRPIAYYPALRGPCGSVNAAVLYCQLAYWTGKGSDPDGWIYKSAEDLTIETGLTYEEQLTARAKLRKRGLVEERYLRSAHTFYFKVNRVALAALSPTPKPCDSPSPGVGIPEIPNTALPRWRDGESPTPEMGNAQLPKWGMPSSLIGTCIDYTETTSESSSRESSAAAATRAEQSISDPEEQTAEMPTTPAEAMRHPAIQLFRDVCGRIPGEKQYRSVIEMINHFQQQHGEGTVEYLRPFWLAWSSRRRKVDGQPYDPASLTWMTEWALNGTIPSEMGGKDGPRQGNGRGVGLEERNRPFTDEQLATIERINAKGGQARLPDL